MSFSTATTWLFSFSLTLAWPSQLRAMTPTGAFCWYSAWCLVGAIIAYFFVPETRGLSLEELDFIFSMPIHIHGANKLQQLQYWLRMRPDRPRDIREIAREHFSAIAAEVQADEKTSASSVKQESPVDLVDTKTSI